MTVEALETRRQRKPNLVYSDPNRIIWPRTLRERNGSSGYATSEDVEIVDPADQYLIEVGQYPLLTPEEERNLTQKIRLGQDDWFYLKNLLNSPNLTSNLKTRIDTALNESGRIVDGRKPNRQSSEKQSMSEDVIEEKIAIVKEANQAFDRLVVSNLRLVVAVAKKYQHHGLPLLDLIQEGAPGLMRAVVKYDRDKGKEKGFENGYKFSTYATWWIRQAVQRAIADKARAIRLPIHLNERRAKIVQTSDVLVQKLQKEPTEAEIAKNMGLSAEQVSAALSPRDTLSLEAEIGKDGNSDLTDVIPDPNQDVEEAATKDELKAKVTEALDCLKLRERKVISLRFGLEDGRSRTLMEVGNEFQVTRERIRQIEVKALAKLHQSPKFQRLAVYLN